MRHPSHILTCITITIMALALPLLAAGNGDVTVKITNSLDDSHQNQVVIGQTNNLEIWIANDDKVLGASWGFELRFTVPHNWVVDTEQRESLPLVEAFGRADSAFDLPGLMVKANFADGELDSLIIGGAAMNAGFDAGPSRLAYRLSFYIPESAEPQEGGLCIKPAFYAPGGTWTSTDAEGGYAPTFNGQTVRSQARPQAQPVCFDIVAAKKADH